MRHFMCDSMWKVAKSAVQINFERKQSNNLRVPSKRVAIVSRNVFWGANSPFRVGIGCKYRNRCFDLLGEPKKIKHWVRGSLRKLNLFRLADIVRVTKKAGKMEAEREIGTEFNFTFSPCTLVLYFGCHRVANIFASRKINSDFYERWVCTGR